MTRYVFHYDLESDRCIDASKQLVAIHRRNQVPATFFVLGTVIEKWGGELRTLFGDDDLFDIQSHTYSHRMLKDNQQVGPGVSLADLQIEIGRGKELVEQRLERECIGIRSGCGFFKGLQGERERLQVIADCGVRYLSSDLRGPCDSIPSGLQQAYWYDEEGQPDLLELPGHGWHDNVLKASAPHLFVTFPPVLSWGIPNRPPRDPQEEVAVQRVWIERAVAAEVDFLSLVYHPHSIYKMDRECRTVVGLLDTVASLGMPTTTYTALYEHYRNAPGAARRYDRWRWEDQYTADGPLQMLDQRPAS